MTAPRPLAYWTSTISRLLDEQAADAVEATGLSRPQWRVLERLAAGAVEREQAPALLAPYAAGEDGVLDRLDSRGLAEEQAQEYRITAKGQALVEELRAGPVEAVTDRATDGLDDGELERLLAGLEKVARSLGWAEVG